MPERARSRSSPLHVSRQESVFPQITDLRTAERVRTNEKMRAKSSTLVTFPRENASGTNGRWSLVRYYVNHKSTAHVM